MKKKLVTALLTLALAVGVAGGLRTASVANAAKTKNVIAVGQETPVQYELTPGKTTEIKLPLRAIGGYIFEPQFEIEVPENAPIEIGQTMLYQVAGEMIITEGITLSTAADTYLHFTVSVKENAKIGKYPVRIKCTECQFSSLVGEDEEFAPNDIVLDCFVAEEMMPAELAISSVKVSGTLEPGKTAKVSFNITNTGEIDAKNVRLSADYSAGFLLPEYTDYTKKLGDMKPNAPQKVTLQVKVLEHVKQSVVQLPLQITYKDGEGNSFEAEENNILYLEVEVPEEETFDVGTLLVSNVRQTPVKPKAGERVSLTFDMENTGEKNYTDTKLYLNYVPNTGFEPVKAEPYQYVGTVKAGQKKTVTVNVVAGKEIAGGMNTLDMDYAYYDGNKEEVRGTVTLYVLNVQAAEESVGLSRPKLMVSQFATSKDVIKSGEEFDFTFDVYNTHSETDARNIKVTVTSEMFSVTKGSNSFFLPVITPGESKSITLNLKASAAAMTGSYPVQIQMEYEYDGMPATEANAGGVEVTETKMLLIKENLRVSVEDVVVGGWNTPMVDQTTQLTFSIYNMGKSTLNNVFFTVEGDFSVANGSSYYYGSLQAGYPDYVEMDIIPLAAGEAKGTLTIHMEDSNGDEVTYTSEISGLIMEMGEDEPGFDIPVDVPPTGELQEQAEPIVSLPVFIAILVALFLVSFFVTRGIRIACYKRKLRKEEV